MFNAEELIKLQKKCITIPRMAIHANIKISAMVRELNRHKLITKLPKFVLEATLKELLEEDPAMTVKEMVEATGCKPTRIWKISKTIKENLYRFNIPMQSQSAGADAAHASDSDAAGAVADAASADTDAAHAARRSPPVQSPVQFAAANAAAASNLAGATAAASPLKTGDSKGSAPGTPTTASLTLATRSATPQTQKNAAESSSTPATPQSSSDVKDVKSEPTTPKDPQPPQANGLTEGAEPMDTTPAGASPAKISTTSSPTPAASPAKGKASSGEADKSSAAGVTSSTPASSTATTEEASTPSRQRYADKENARLIYTPPLAEENSPNATNNNNNSALLPPDMVACEQCGKAEHKTKLKKKRFCSLVCARQAKASLGSESATATDAKVNGGVPPAALTLNGADTVAANGLPEKMQIDVPAVAPSLPLVNGVSHLSPQPANAVAGVPQQQQQQMQLNATDPNASGAGLAAPVAQASDVPQIANWSVAEVSEFIRNLPGCVDYADDFEQQEIDGQALLLLKENHLLNAMGMKLGPALKILAKVESMKEVE